MLLFAAEGGGIRAAYWTVRGLQAIDDTTCGERSALFSAGASGGSVGLTVARFSGTPDRPNTAGAVDAVKQMAAPRSCPGPPTAPSSATWSTAPAGCRCSTTPSPTRSPGRTGPG